MEYLKIFIVFVIVFAMYEITVGVDYLMNYFARRSVDKMMDVKREPIAKDFKLFILKVIHEFGPSKLNHYISERRIQKLLDKEYMKHKKGEY